MGGKAQQDIASCDLAYFKFFSAKAVNVHIKLFKDLSQNLSLHKTKSECNV
jgi:hypothetical protein